MSKLVRDNIPEIMRKQNKNPIIKTLSSDQEYFVALEHKLLEEIHEFFTAEGRLEAISEIADILEVLDALIMAKGYDYQEIQTCKLKKKEERGGFEKRIFLKL